MSSKFAQLVTKARNGSEDAARELIEKYEGHVLRAVRCKMAKAMRSKFDSEDFVQAVWQSVFCNRDARLTADTPEKFIKLLAVIARNKVLDEQRRRLDTLKHDLSRESLYEDGAAQVTSTPSQIFIATETLEQLLANEPAHYQEVVRLRAQGCTQGEIAKRTGMAERTVRRVLARLSKGNVSLN